MKKRFLAFLIIVCMMLTLTGCGDNGKGNNEDPYQYIISSEQDFSTKCLSVYETKFVDGEGLYIYLGDSADTPYILVYRYADMPIEAKQLLEESVYQRMVETYGDGLEKCEQIQDYIIDDEKIPSVRFIVKDGEDTFDFLYLCMQRDSNIILFNAVYREADSKKTLEALETAVKNYNEGTDIPANDKSGNNKTRNKGKDKNLTITTSEAASVEYEIYSDPTGCFTAEIPEGWEVKTGIKPSGELDLISYAISVYDPDNVDRQLYMNLNCNAGLQSQEAHDWYVNYYGEDNLFAQLPIVGTTTESFFNGMCGYYDYSDFVLLENLGQGATGGDVLVANCTSSITGKQLEGIFSAWIVANSYKVQKNMFDYRAGMVDAGPVTAYSVIMETAPCEEFIDYQPILEHILSSISFTDSFQSQRQSEWKQVIGTSNYLLQTANEISDMIMDSWEYRNTVYDVNSQKTSDAMLGYDRVLDTETNEYYKADSGFGDWYDGTRYQVVDDDTAYLSPISGYIEWK